MSLVLIKSIAAWLTWPAIFIGQLIAFDRALCFDFDPALTLLG